MPVNGATSTPSRRALPRRPRAARRRASGSTRTRTSARTTRTGRKADPEEILGGLDQAGHQRALVFAMHEPDGYGPANDAVLRGDAASGGRLVPLRARRARTHEDAVAEAKRCLRGGRPRLQAPPALGRVRAAAPGRGARSSRSPTSARMPVLFHAGRGIPHLGEAVVDLARALPRRPADPRPRRHQRPRLDRAATPPSCRISSSTPRGGWSPTPPAVRDDPARADPLRERHALRPGAVDGVHLPARRAGGRPRGRRVRAIAGGQLERVMAGEDPIDLGPAPGLDSVGPRVIAAERVVAYCATALQLSFRGLDPTESIALARLACRTGADDDTGRLLTYVDRLLEIAPRERRRRARGAARADPGAAARADDRGHADGRAAGRPCVIRVTRRARTGATVIRRCRTARSAAPAEPALVGLPPAALSDARGVRSREPEESNEAARHPACRGRHRGAAARSPSSPPQRSRRPPVQTTLAPPSSAPTPRATSRSPAASSMSSPAGGS